MAYPMASEIAGGSAEVPDIRFEQYREERDMPGLDGSGRGSVGLALIRVVPC